LAQLAASHSNVRAFNFGLGEREGSLTLHTVKGETDSPLSSLHEGVVDSLFGRAVEPIPVQVRSLDEVFSSLHIAKIDLLKIDTEGHELSVLKGASNAFEQQLIDAVQFEFNDMNVFSRIFFRDFWEFFAKHDFTLQRLLPEGHVPIRKYIPMVCEFFAYQNIVALRRVKD
jgi:FkbM family methyltransferase